VVEQIADIVRGQPDVAQDLFPARPREIDPVGLEDQLPRERGVERLLLEQLPPPFLDVPAAERFQGLEVGLAPPALVGVPVPLPDRGPGLGLSL
jgi:hypothetical protein